MAINTYLPTITLNANGLISAKPDTICDRTGNSHFSLIFLFNYYD